MTSMNTPSSPRLIVACTLDTIKTPLGVRWRKIPHVGARYKASDGQRYIVNARGELRRCDEQFNITTRVRMSKKDRRRLQLYPKR